MLASFAPHAESHLAQSLGGWLRARVRSGPPPVLRFHLGFCLIYKVCSAFLQEPSGSTGDITKLSQQKRRGHSPHSFPRSEPMLAMSVPIPVMHPLRAIPPSLLLSLCSPWIPGVLTHTNHLHRPQALPPGDPTFNACLCPQTSPAWSLVPGGGGGVRSRWGTQSHSSPHTHMHTTQNTHTHIPHACAICMHHAHRRNTHQNTHAKVHTLPLSDPHSGGIGA